MGNRNKEINEEVEKLLDAGILRESIFPIWITNMMVKKYNGSWHMCIDHFDINNACPKAHYPLLEIDQKVESLEAFHFK